MIRRWVCRRFGHKAPWSPCDSDGTARPHEHRWCPRCGRIETRETPCDQRRNGNPTQQGRKAVA